MGFDLDLATRVIDDYREGVERLTEQAMDKLEALGVTDADVPLLPPPPRHGRAGSRRSGTRTPGAAAAGEAAASEG